MKLGIIGATGMLGHHAALAAHAAGHEVIVIHRTSSDLSRLGDLTYQSAVASLDDQAALTEALTGLDAVVSAAAYYPTLPRPWRDDLRDARLQMARFLAAVSASNIARAVYVGGSIALPRRADGRPADEADSYSRRPGRNPYVVSKWAMDQMAREAASNGLPVTIAIPSMTFGEYDYGPSTGQFITRIANREMPKYVDGQRNVIYAGDAGRGIVRVAEAGRSGERYLLTGSNTDMKTLVGEIAEITGRPEPSPAPLIPARLLAAAQARRYRSFGGALPKISQTAIAIMASGQHLDGGKAAAELGFRAETAPAEAIAKAYRWFQQVGYIH